MRAKIITFFTCFLWNPAGAYTEKFICGEERRAVEATILESYLEFEEIFVVNYDTIHLV